MNLLESPFARFVLFSLAGIIALFPATLRAQTATQTLTLVKGWNSVWLEVEPIDAEGKSMAPEDVFGAPNGDAKIEIVTTPKPLAGLAEFFPSDPGATTIFNQEQWQEWKPNNPLDTNTLPLISGNRPYLIKTSAAVTLSLTGKVRFFRPTWTPDRYNLVGFGLEGTPSFTDFFGPSGTTHPVPKIFRLNDLGTWTPVSGTTTMRSDEAYWVFCSGPSSYMGPMSVDFEGSATGQLNFGGPSDAVPVGTGDNPLELDLEELVFTNLSANSVSPALELDSVDGPGLTLHVVSPEPGSLGYLNPRLLTSSPDSLGETFDPGKTAYLTLGAQRNWNADSNSRTKLYRLKTGISGASFWLPITAIRSGISQAAAEGLGNPTSDATGLWVGEVIFDSVTSIVEDGSPSRPSAGTVPVRILLHFDGSTVRLLSQVTIMQTKTANPDEAPLPVLVVDPARIPFFEGIKERNSKKVGIRIESVAYDMPRDTTLATQQKSPITTESDDIIDMIVTESTNPNTKWSSGKGLYPNRASLTPEKVPAAIAAYLQFRSLRPPALKERYQLTVPVNGALAAGQTLSGSLTLDPFHRSNPFRHAYHQNLPKGPNITRTIEIVLDPAQAIQDRLRGSFQETLHGLIKSNLILSGRIELHRVSPVGTLEGAE